MAKATVQNTTRRARSGDFLIAVNRLSLMIRDPFVAAAFRAAEDDGTAPAWADVDQPKVLDGGAAELVPTAGRRVAALIEA